MSYESQFLVALLVTTLVEVPVAALVLYKWFRTNELPLRRVIFAAALVSALTLPYFWFVLPAFVTNHTLYVWGGEVTIWLIEALLYRELLGLSWKRALVASFCTNATSLLVGFVL